MARAIISNGRYACMFDPVTFRPFGPVLMGTDPEGKAERLLDLCDERGIRPERELFEVLDALADELDLEGVTA